MSEEPPNYWPDVSWKIRLAVSIFSFGVNTSCRSDGTINRRISSFFDFKASPSQKPINGVKTSDIIVDSSRNLWFRLFIPATSAQKDGSDDVTLPVIIYFHGGGFAFMSANSRGFDNQCRRLAKEIPCVVISVNYRLSPEHRYPCQYEDGFDVLKFIDNNTNFEGFPSFANLNHCFVAGDSAGGNLAHHVAHKACEYQFHNLKVIGLIAIQPFFGGEERTESEIRLVRTPSLSVEGTDWMWKAFLPEGSDRDHPAANVFGPNTIDISELEFPATVVFVGGFDLLQDWQRRYYEGLKKYGKEAYLIEYPNMIHGFYAFTELKESGLLIEEVRGFMQKQSAK